jgi:hypothetical protein
VHLINGTNKHVPTGIRGVGHQDAGTGRDQNAGFARGQSTGRPAVAQTPSNCDQPDPAKRPSPKQWTRFPRGHRRPHIRIGRPARRSRIPRAPITPTQVTRAVAIAPSPSPRSRPGHAIAITRSYTSTGHFFRAVKLITLHRTLATNEPEVPQGARLPLLSPSPSWPATLAGTGLRLATPRSDPSPGPISTAPPRCRLTLACDRLTTPSAPASERINYLGALGNPTATRRTGSESW